MNKTRLGSEDNHHIVFSKRAWESVRLPDENGAVKEVGLALREQGSLIVPMDRGEHEKLHALTPAMPALGALAVHAVLLDYTNHIKDPSTHPAKTIDRLRLSFDRIPDKYLRLDEKEMIELCIGSLDTQLPLIRDAVDNRQYYINQAKGRKKAKAKERRSGRQRVLRRR